MDNSVEMFMWVKVGADASTQRMKIPEGWLYKYYNSNGVSMVFVPNAPVNSWFPIAAPALPNFYNPQPSYPPQPQNPTIQGPIYTQTDILSYSVGDVVNGASSSMA